METVAGAFLDVSREMNYLSWPGLFRCVWLDGWLSGVVRRDVKRDGLQSAALFVMHVLEDM